MQKWLQTNINKICRERFNFLFAIQIPLFSVDRALLVYILPDARLSRYSYNKHGLIKPDRVTMLSYDYVIFLNIKIPRLLC